MLLLAGFAFVAGVVTALSPCVLPALPIVVAGAAGGGRRRLAGIAAGFVGTFVLFTLALTAALRAAGVSPTALRNLAIALLALFGLALVLPRLDARVARMLAPAQRLGDRLPRGGSGLGGGLAVGIALGLVWTPCAGPIFATIAALAAIGGAGPGTFVVLAAYSVGAVLPMLAVARGGRALVRRLGPRVRAVRPAMGTLMVAAAVVLFLGIDTRLTAAALEDLPAYAEALQVLERTDLVQDRLAELRGGGPTPLIAAAAAAPATPEADLDDLPDAGPAPELRDISTFYNTGGEPITLRSLRGRVVLLDFWTYSCVNCLRTLPHLRALDDEYREAGLTIVGVHTPEFLFEGDPGNVGRAVRDLGIEYPVALDPEYGTWQAYGNNYWPATYLIDRRGHVRHLKVGEGRYEETEALVRRALGLPPDGAPPAAPEPARRGQRRTPELYLGAARLDARSVREQLVPGRASAYRAPFRLPPDQLALSGRWTVSGEDALAGRAASIELSFLAREVNLVLDGRGRTKVGRVLLDGRPIAPDEAGADVGPDGRLAVAEPRLYALVDLPGAPARHRLRIELAPGTSGYAFTFG